MAILLLKLFLAPVLVVASTLAGRRWGPGVAGILVGLPIVAGPILFISYLQNGADFAADASSSSLLGLVSLAAFAVVFSRTARRFAWLATLAATWTVVLAVDIALFAIHATTLVAFVFTLAAAAAAMFLIPGSEESSATPERPSPLWDLPGRAIATGILVLVVTSAAGSLGPHWTGILAPFPIATSVVAAFVHAQHGHAMTARTLAGVLMGLFSFAIFCLAVTVLIRPMGGAAFALAAAVTIAVQLLAVRTRAALRNRRTRLRK